MMNVQETLLLYSAVLYLKWLDHYFGEMLLLHILLMYLHLPKEEQ